MCRNLSARLPVILLLFLFLAFPAGADSLAVKVRIILGSPALAGALDFRDMAKPGGQTLSIMLTDALSELVSNATVNANITLPDGTLINATFSETNAGNYTFFYNFTDIGDHTISVHISKSGFQLAAGSKTIHVGLVRLVDFTSDSEVFQGSTMRFRFSAKNTGNISSTMVPSFRIYDAAGSLVFSKEGFASELEANMMAALIQFNTMSWFVGSAAPGVYNASGRILFTDPDNATAYTPNRTLAFTVLASAVPQPVFSGGGGQIIRREIITPPAVGAEPVREFMVSSAPALVEVYQTDFVTVPLTVTNPLNKSISNISVSVKGIPGRWYFLPVDIIELAPGETITIPVTFTIPANAEIGSRQATISIENHELRKETNYVLRVSQTSLQQPARTYESVNVDELSNTTSVNIRVKNREDSAKTMRVAVRIDKSVAQSVEEVVFVTKPSRIIEPDPLVEFELDNMKPAEERNITYFVRKLVVDTAPFAYSSIEQIQFVEIRPPLPVAAVEEKYIYTTAAFALGAMAAITVVYIQHRKRIKEAINEAKRAVLKLAEKQ